MYYCEFPNCSYSTNIRSQIHNHHIIPRSKGGSNKSYNSLLVCPTCHSKIFIPSETTGIHSQKSKDSIIIKRWVDSTINKLLEYSLIDSEHLLYYRRNYKYS